MDAEPVPRTSKVKKSINQKIKDAKAKPGVIIEGNDNEDIILVLCIIIYQFSAIIN